MSQYALMSWTFVFEDSLLLQLLLLLLVTTINILIKYWHQKYFVLSHLLGRCLQFPGTEIGILRENEFHLPFLYYIFFIEKKTGI